MPTTSFLDHVHQVQRLLDELLFTGEAQLLSFQVDARSNQRGFLAGIVQFQDDTQLHFREFVDTSQSEPRLMYAYHYQSAKQELIFRYDNAAHRPTLPQLQHKHTPDGIELPPSIPSFEQLLSEML